MRFLCRQFFAFIFCVASVTYVFAPFLSLSLLHRQVAIIAGNFDLAEIIKVHKVSDVGKLTAVVVFLYLAASVFHRFRHE